MVLALNLSRETHKAHSKKIDDQIDGIGKWIDSVGGQNSKEAVDFVYKYIEHLNDQTKKSMYEHILDQSNTRFVEINKQNDLMILLNNLVKLIKEVTTL